MPKYIITSKADAKQLLADQVIGGLQELIHQDLPCTWAARHRLFDIAQVLAQIKDWLNQQPSEDAGDSDPDDVPF